MTTPQPFLSLKNVTLKQGSENIFPNTNWTVYSNEHWIITGPNGSGKSILMQAICGRVPVTNGEIVYHFASKTGGKPDAHIAYVAFDAVAIPFDGQSFYQTRWNAGISESSVTVAEALSEQRIWQRNPFEIVERTDNHPDFNVHRTRIIDQMDIRDLLKREIHQLSNGEWRKMCIARALLRQPKLLILDNVFEGLDPDYRLHLAQLLPMLMQSSMRLFLVTADPHEIPSSFTHHLVIQDHRIIAQGTSVVVSSTVSHTHSLPTPTAQLADHTPLSQPQDKVPDILIRMENVTIKYNDAYILHDVNWEVRRGERWALLGHNGAGKTTLLSLIMGDNPQAYANEIELFGRRRGSGESIWEIKRRIGWMAPELHRYYPPMLSCFDVVCSGWFDSVGLFKACTEQQRNAAHAVMVELNINTLAQQQFRKASETQQRLVLLARALVKRPQLLILDEPCQGLDTHNRHSVYQILDKSIQWAESLILVTHQIHRLPQTITHILTLNMGHTTSRGVHHQETL
jgi:molybdate transport system ATP-binding protein